jgi:predicted hotdog family 3-hydroxylacyl-ACP dehydratase
MLIGKEELCNLIPHAGNMCLLEGVLEWSAGEIRCSALSHTNPDNPLRRNARLASVHLLEYGAQAMAVHGGLLARKSGTRVLPGYLAALRDVVLQQEFIDHITAPLTIHAQMIATLADSFMYRFSVIAGGIELASARATVISRKDTAP